jgi:hypothetical protein
MAPAAPTSPPVPVGAISVYTPDVPPPAVTGPREVAGTTGFLPAAPAARPLVGAGLVSVRRPEGNDGIWIRFLGMRWVSAGASVSAIGNFERVGDYAGLPVFRRSDADEPVIYLPTAAGRFAPYRARE